MAALSPFGGNIFSALFNLKRPRATKIQTPLK
uniref:Uncharacterized protein n=1 Tax=viral metagenome TaxID=1070528 RepID=A0A6C0BV21_9ZZZZ